MTSAALNSFDISYCRREDVKSLKRFIHEHWRANHVMAVDDELFEWQHFDRRRDLYTFAIAKNSQNEIVGALGFISDNQFRVEAGTKERLDSRVVWLAIWKVLESLKNPGLGLKLREYIEKTENPAMMSAVGLNPRTIPLYKHFGYQIGKLNQFYLLNDGMSDFKIAAGTKPTLKHQWEADDSKFTAVDAHSLESLPFDHWTSQDFIPRKDLGYILGRYVNHPRYEYSLMVVGQAKTPAGLLIVRNVSALGRSAIRVVDYVGEFAALAKTRPAFQSLLKVSGAEYVDCLNFGIDPKIFRSAGFSQVEPNDTCIIPNYFEPFESRQVEINFAYKIRGSGQYIAFKGDADQDRPNQLPSGQKPR